MAELIQARPIILNGIIVRLEPLTELHISGLAEIGMDENIWRYMMYGTMRGEKDMQSWVQSMLELAARGTDIPFAVIHLPSGRIAGATRYLDIRPAHRSLEVGGTWYGTEFQRTAVNTECKYLLLSHAFEELRCIRVQLKTDSRNERSQRAMERIGAYKEGTLRNHMILPDGTIRDSVYYSILDSEWPNVKIRLRSMLG